MTNLEKFEEVFGIELDPNHYVIKDSDFPCESTRFEFCDNRRCDECSARNFWNKEYVKKPNNTRIEDFLILDRKEADIFNSLSNEQKEVVLVLIDNAVRQASDLGSDWNHS